MAALNKILVVEDEPDDFELLREHFRRRDEQHASTLYYLECCANRDEAMRRLSLDDWAFFIVDYRLGGPSDPNGLDFIRDAFAQGHQTPALLVSGTDALAFDHETIDLIRRRKLRFLSKHQLNWSSLASALAELLPRAYRILLVDDDPDDRLLAKEQLRSIEHMSIEIDEAAGLAEAKRLVATQSYDAIMLDYLLGAERGTGLLADLPAYNSEAIVALCSGYGSFQIDAHALQLIAQQRLRFMTKDQINRNSLSRILLDTDVSGRHGAATGLNLPNAELCGDCQYYRAANQGT